MTTTAALAAYHAAMQPAALRRSIAARYRDLRRWARRPCPDAALDAWRAARRDVLEAIARRRPRLDEQRSYADRMAVINDAIGVE